VKTCPNCGKENKDEAVLCHYCWHELPQPIPPPLPRKTKKTEKTGTTKRSIWATGAMWAAVITGLVAIGVVIIYFHSFKEISGSLAIGAPLSFIFLWPICTLITWRWRKAGQRRNLEIGGIVFVSLLWVTLSFAAETLLNPTAKPIPIPQITPTTTATMKPTLTISSICNAWEAITSAQVGQTLCIYGKVYEFSGTVILFTRNNSQVRIIYRPIGTYIRLRTGDCIEATGPITQENGILMLSTSEISDCPPGLIP
jgi:hypothetical protein